MIAPLALILGLALAGGGFDLSDRHIAGLAVWLVVVVLLALGAAGRATLGRPFYWASGLILGLALFSAISSLWSGSIELSVTEADRVLVYLGFFLAAFLIAQTDQRRQRFAEGIAIASDRGRACSPSPAASCPTLDLGRPELGQRRRGCATRSATGTPTAIVFGIGDRAGAVDEPALADRGPALARGRRRCRR